MDDAAAAGLVDALNEAVKRVEAAARSVPADGWDAVIQTGDGAWTRRQLFAHMAANDLRQIVRIRVGAGVALPGDAGEHEAELRVDEWNEARVAERNGADLESLIEEMRVNRASLVALIRGLTPEQRERPMPFRGIPTPLREMVAIVIRHLDGHAEELAAGR